MSYLLSSICLDWYARRYVDIHMDAHLLYQLPIPYPDLSESLTNRCIQLGGRLACPDDRFNNWAKDVGVESGPLDYDTKQDMINELDAVVAHLYGIDEKKLIHIFETFHEGWDYKSRLYQVLKHYHALAAKA